MNRRPLTLILACFAALAPALPASALDWGHSTDEVLVDRVHDAGQHLNDKQFQAYVKTVNVQNRGRTVRRAGWVVEATEHVSLPGIATVHVSKRSDRGGVSWTLYVPGTIGLKLRPGDQIEWEGMIERIEPSGEVRLARERILRRVPGGYNGVPEDWQVWQPGWPGHPERGGRLSEPPWWFHSLAERPLVRRVDPVMPTVAYQEGVFANPTVRVWVSPPGHVARAEIARSSGRADVDASVIDAVRRWRYQPFPPGRTEDQIGEITVPIKAY